MKAAVYREFKGPIRIEDLPDPKPHADGVVVKVEANGICRSDWHAWHGRDADVQLPHVPGHELAGVVESIGKDVKNWQVGDRVTVPFMIGCGYCEQCRAGDQHICDNYFQPGFTAWGSFAQYVALRRADINLVRLPDSMDFAEAAALGCRFITAYRAVVDQGRCTGGEWVAVHGCGGVGLSAVMIAAALGARVIAVDITDEKLAMAKSLGAVTGINASEVDDVTEAILSLTKGGAHLSLDALGSPTTAYNSIANLRKRGRHVQVGLLAETGGDTTIPMGAVIWKELEIYGSHGMQAHRFDGMMAMITDGHLQLDKLIGARVTLEESVDALTNLGDFKGNGVTVIDRF